MALCHLKGVAHNLKIGVRNLEIGVRDIEIGARKTHPRFLGSSISLIREDSDAKQSYVKWS